MTQVSTQRMPDGSIKVTTDRLEAKITPTGYVSGVAAGSLRDIETGAREQGFGLDIVDFLMEPGWGSGKWHDENFYERNPLIHGHIPKRYVELPQICTQAKKVQVECVVGKRHAIIRQSWRWKDAAPGYKAGSLWEQTLLFLSGRRYFFACDKITSVNTVKELFLRIDMPGHLKHNNADTFEEIFLSYYGRIPSSNFLSDFAPDSKFFYQRSSDPLPESIIRSYKLRSGPWLAGITLCPKIVSEAWCHQRGYVCFIEEIGRLPVRSGDSFSATYAIGFFDDIEEMKQVSREYGGFTSIAGNADWWCLSEGVLSPDGAEGLNGSSWKISSQGRWEMSSSGTWRTKLNGEGKISINHSKFVLHDERDLEVAIKVVPRENVMGQF